MVYVLLVTRSLLVLLIVACLRMASYGSFRGTKGSSTLAPYNNGREAHFEALDLTFPTFSGIINRGSLGPEKEALPFYET